MTVYELIGKLSSFPPDVEVVIIPQKRKRWNQKDSQRVDYVFGRGLKIDTGNEPIVELCGVSDETI